MGQNPELRNRLESAVINQQQAVTLQKTAKEAENENKSLVQAQQPTIMLKTKFEFSKI